MITIHSLRKSYIEFFVSKGHAEISGKSLIPDNDPTVLFTTAGMHPLVPYLLGEAHPKGKRLTNYQKCIRTGDIESVGDPSHLTFFEMLGNWSLGDYFKKEAITWSFEFLTSPKYLGIPVEKLSVTVFAGEEGIPRDSESASVWEALGIPKERIYFLPREDNWWGPAGETGPCGPDSEMFFDTGKTACGPECKPGCSCGKYFEVWNDVFMQYNKNAEGKYEPLSAPCVDTGMGIERTVAMLQGKKSVYDTEAFIPILAGIGNIAGKEYGRDSELDYSFRIIADHIRTSTMIIGDPKGLAPSNIGAGYVLRRLIRRAVRHGRKLGIEKNFLAELAGIVIDFYAAPYPELITNREKILSELTAEETKFSETLHKGEEEWKKLLPNLQKNPQKVVAGRVAFRLYDTFGFPVEMTQELAREEGMSVDIKGFEEEFKKHQELSRQGAEAFKGGLADHSEMATKYHTATHLLHRALKNILGEHVNQKGSNITSERLRFDFSHPAPISKEDLAKIEAEINRVIEGKLPVTMVTMKLDDAKSQGVTALFGEKYEEVVKVYSIGDYSREVCGGPHIENTSVLGKFRIQKEQSSSAGVRRIYAVLE